jgi:ribosomal protein S18 acetylase RimI-like enzyme
MPDEVLDGLSVESREQMWRQALSDEEREPVYVAVDDGVVVGFCAIVAPSRDADADADADAEDRVAEVGAIYVHPDVWRTGVGRALMDVALVDLRAAGWDSVTLWVLAENWQARAFYGRFGFEPDGAEMTHERSGATEVRLRSSIGT